MVRIIPFLFYSIPFHSCYVFVRAVASFIRPCVLIMSWLEDLEKESLPDRDAILNQYALETYITRLPQTVEPDYDVWRREVVPRCKLGISTMWPRETFLVKLEEYQARKKIRETKSIALKRTPLTQRFSVAPNNNDKYYLW